MGLEQNPQRKLRLLGLHGFRTSGDILRRQLSKWGHSLTDLFDVDYLNGPFPASGKSDVEGIFEGPYYEFYSFNKDYTEFYHVEEVIAYVSDYLKLHGPYDGIIGFSQGAVIGGCLAALQEKGLALQDVPPIRVLLLISPAQLRAQHLKPIYEEPTIKCPTLAFLGDRDWMKIPGIEVLKSFENHVRIDHRYGHTVPKLDETQIATAAQFVKSQLAAIYPVNTSLKSEVETQCVSLDEADKIEDVAILKTNATMDSHNEDLCVTA